MLARTRTRALWHSGRGAIAWHRGGCQLDGGPNGNGAGRGGRDGADETVEQDRNSNPAPQDFWVSLQASFLLKAPTPVFCDNDTATGLAGGRRRSPNSKHIAIKYHYTRQLVAQGVIIVLRVPTDDNRADLLTKPVKGPVFLRLIVRLRGRGARL